MTEGSGEPSRFEKTTRHKQVSIIIIRPIIYAFIITIYLLTETTDRCLIKFIVNFWFHVLTLNCIRHSYDVNVHEYVLNTDRTCTAIRRVRQARMHPSVDVRQIRHLACA